MCVYATRRLDEIACAEATLGRRLLADRNGLPRALTNRFEHLCLVLRRDFLLQYGQRVVILESKNLGYDAHAHTVAFAQTPVDVDLLGHSRHLIATPSPG